MLRDGEMDEATEPEPPEAEPDRSEPVWVGNRKARRRMSANWRAAMGREDYGEADRLRLVNSLRTQKQTQ